MTLIRTWGFQEERRVRMLTNFLDLVEAVEIVGLLEIDEERISRADNSCDWGVVANLRRHWTGSSGGDYSLVSLYCDRCC